VVDERLEALSEWVDSAQNTVDYVPRKARRDYAPQSMYDVLKGFGRRVALPRFLEMEKELRGYLATIVLDALR
jgi:hypothetical protein